MSNNTAWETKTKISYKMDEFFELWLKANKLPINTLTLDGFRRGFFDYYNLDSSQKDDYMFVPAGENMWSLMSGFNVKGMWKEVPNIPVLVDSSKENVFRAFQNNETTHIGLFSLGFSSSVTNMMTGEKEEFSSILLNSKEIVQVDSWKYIADDVLYEKR